MRIWCRIIKDSHLIRDIVAENNDPSMTRTMKVYDCLEKACYELDLEKPIWLDANKRDFVRHARTRFTRDSFMEEIDFDYLDFRVIEEDY